MRLKNYEPRLSDREFHVRTSILSFQFHSWERNYFENCHLFKWGMLNKAFQILLK